MNPRFLLLLTFALAIRGALAVDAPAAAAPAAASRRSRTAEPVAVPAPKTSLIAPSLSFDAFRLISDRNVFNPNRSGRRDRGSEERAPRLDVISLVGTMESDKGLRAFFDGSDSSFRKARRVGESVDKFKVTQIAPNVVDLERDGKPLSMRVGQQLRRPEGGDWNLIGEDVVLREAQAQAASEAASKIDPLAPVAIPAGASDTLRKLMEARNKQLKP